MSHVPVIPLKVYVLSVVHILARGNPQQTTETDLGCVGAREASVLRSTEHHPHEFRFVLPIVSLGLKTEALLPFSFFSIPHARHRIICFQFAATLRIPVPCIL